MPGADISPVIGNPKARIQGSKEDSAACPSYSFRNSLQFPKEAEIP